MGSGASRRTQRLRDGERQRVDHLRYVDGAEVVLLDDDPLGRHLGEPDLQPSAVLESELVAVGQIADPSGLEDLLAGQPVDRPGEVTAQQVDGYEAFALRTQ